MEPPLTRFIETPVLHHASRGLALLEVVVALVVIASFGAALFTWSGQTLQMARRATEAMDDAALERNVTELAVTLNPAQRPEGRLQTAAHTIEWRATEQRPRLDHIRHPQGVSPYAVTLYQVRFRILSPSGQLLLQTDRLVAGWAQVRVRPSGLPGFPQ